MASNCLRMCRSVSVVETFSRCECVWMTVIGLPLREEMAWCSLSSVTLYSTAAHRQAPSPAWALDVRCAFTAASLSHACLVLMCDGSSMYSWMSPSTSTRYEDSSPAVINTLPRRLMCMTLPDACIARMHSPQVDEVLWVATPLTDPSVLEYISPLALFRWASSTGDSGTMVFNCSVLFC